MATEATLSAEADEKPAVTIDSLLARKEELAAKLDVPPAVAKQWEAIMEDDGKRWPPSHLRILRKAILDRVALVEKRRAK